MGTEYSIACLDCKVTRDLDKFYSAMNVSDRKEALAACADMEKDSFRAVLLTSFLRDHIGHKCVFFNEHSECSGKYDPWDENEFKKDLDYWKPDKEAS